MIQCLAVLLQLAAAVVQIKLIRLGLVVVLEAAHVMEALEVLATRHLPLHLKVITEVRLLAVVAVVAGALVRLALMEQVSVVLVEQVQLTVLQVLLQPMLVVVVVVVMVVMLVVLVVLAAVVQAVLAQALELPHPVQTELHLLAVVVVVLVTKAHLLYQVTVATAALVS